MYVFSSADSAIVLIVVFVFWIVILEFVFADSNMSSQPVQGKLSGPPSDIDGLFYGYVTVVPICLYLILSIPPPRPASFSCSVFTANPFLYSSLLW